MSGYARLSAADRGNLRIERPETPAHIAGLCVVEAGPLVGEDGELDLAAVRTRLERRLSRAPELRWVVRRPPPLCGPPLWVDDPDFSIARHVHAARVDPPGDEAGLLRTAELLLRPRLDRSRPLWELWFLPGLPDRRVGAYLKLHHVLADGPAAMAAFGALLDQTADAPDQGAPPWTPTPSPSTGELLRDNIRRRREELGHGWSAFVHPSRTLSLARRALPAWREVLTERPAPRTSLNHPVGPERRLAIVRGRLDPTRRVAHIHHAKVNDVVLAAVTGGLRELLADRGENVQGLVQRAMVTISHQEERPGAAQGNKPGWMMVPLPVSEPDPARRLELIAAETGARKDKARPEAGSGIFRFVACQRVWYRLFPRQRSVNLVVSNVPGPPVPLYLAGAPLLEVFPLLPPMGNLTLVVAALSYARQLNLLAAADRDSCPDVEVFAYGVRAALDDLAPPALAPAT